MNGLKNKLKEMNYDTAAIIDPKSLKKVLGGLEIDTWEKKKPKGEDSNTICKEKAISGEEE